MSTLFPIEPVFPKGFSYIPDFLTEAEETELLVLISQYALQPMMFKGFEAKRKVMSFGVDYHFESRSVTSSIPIPGSFSFLLKKVSAFTLIPENQFEEMLLTEYPPGSVINWHRDGPPFEIIIGISLSSDCTFRLRPYDKAKRSRSSVLSFTVERRSFYCMQGQSRENWEHSILPVTHTRYSITLRTLRNSNT